LPWEKMSTQRARQLRKDMTDAERALWMRLRRRQLLGMKFRRQQPLGAYIVDFVCLEKKLVVEVDGGQHADRQEYDAQRTRWLEEQGFRVMRFWNHQVLTEPDSVIQAVADTLAPPPAPPAAGRPPPRKGGGDCNAK
jgi:very-short-patch-repair endonuclease